MGIDQISNCTLEHNAFYWAMMNVINKIQVAQAIFKPSFAGVGGPIIVHLW